MCVNRMSFDVLWSEKSDKKLYIYEEKTNLGEIQKKAHGSASYKLKKMDFSPLVFVVVQRWAPDYMDDGVEILLEYFRLVIYFVSLHIVPHSYKILLIGCGFFAFDNRKYFRLLSSRCRGENRICFSAAMFPNATASIVLTMQYFILVCGYFLYLYHMCMCFELKTIAVMVSQPSSRRKSL